LYLLSPGEDLWNRINCLERELEFDDNESKLNLNNANIEKYLVNLEQTFRN